MGRRHSQFKKILVGFDGSAQSEKATECALALAASLDSQVLLFAVARPPEPATMVELDAMLDDAREHFEAQFKTIRARAIKLEVALETEIVVGHPVEQIVHRAESHQIDLIILGRRGVSRLERMIIGSTSEKVLRYAHCPVLVVR
ncbi:MAG TPA: universal stress protein [Candidatus Binatia bacterium]|nr:universal stress protein [Candidatus Binatia bacterium]